MYTHPDLSSVPRSADVAVSSEWRSEPLTIDDNATVASLAHVKDIPCVKSKHKRYRGCRPSSRFTTASLLADGFRVPLAIVCIDNRPLAIVCINNPSDAQSCSRSHRTALYMMALARIHPLYCQRINACQDWG